MNTKQKRKKKRGRITTALTHYNNNDDYYINQIIYINIIMFILRLDCDR